MFSSGNSNEWGSLCFCYRAEILTAGLDCSDADIISKPADAGHQKKLKAIVVEMLGVTDMDKKHFTIKWLVEDQNFSRMLGYCQQDKDKPHFEFVRMNVSEAELTQGRVDYGKVAFDYRQNMKELDKYVVIVYLLFITKVAIPIIAMLKCTCIPCFSAMQLVFPSQAHIVMHLILLPKPLFRVLTLYMYCTFPKL